MKPVVKAEFAALIPPLSDEERAGLEASIVAEGCRDALVAWKGILLDGHNRLEICRSRGRSFKTVEVEGVADEVAAKLWIIRNQLARRNLGKFQRSELALAMKALLAEKAKERQGTRTDLRSNILQNSGECSEDKRTDAQVAKAAGVSHDTVHKVDVIKKQAPPELIEQARRGEVSVNKAYQQVRPRAKPHRAEVLSPPGSTVPP